MKMNVRKGVDMSKVSWLMIIGGIFGILGGLVAILMQGNGEAFNTTSGSSLYYGAAEAI
jgi:hypothetical protein